MHVYQRYDSEKRLLSGPLLFHALDDEIEQLKKDPEWGSRHRTAVTLVKEPGLSVVLITLQKGATLQEHHAEGPITVVVLSGAISFQAAKETLHLRQHGMVSLEKTIPHDLEALEESALLVTIVQPEP